MIHFTKLFNRNRKHRNVIDTKLNADSIAAKHSYYIKQKQMKNTNGGIISGLAKLLVIAMLIVLAGYVATQAFTSAEPLLDQLEANYEDSSNLKCVDERELSRGKLLALKIVSRETHEALKISMERQGLEYRWNTPEGFIDIHMVSVPEDAIRIWEEKAAWTCGQETEDFQ